MSTRRAGFEFDGAGDVRYRLCAESEVDGVTVRRSLVGPMLSIKTAKTNSGPDLARTAHSIRIRRISSYSHEYMQENIIPCVFYIAPLAEPY